MQGRFTSYDLPKPTFGLSFQIQYYLESYFGKDGKKLARWEKLQLSKGGRTNLIKDTLSSIPTYFMSLFMISTLVANKLEKFQREFPKNFIRWNGEWFVPT